MYFAVLLVIVPFLIWVAAAYGPRTAMRWGWGFAMLVPVWMVRHAGSVDVDLKMMIVATVLACLAFRQKQKLIGRFVLSDALVLSLVLALGISHFLNYEFGPGTPIGLAVIWLIPYAFGRICFQSPEDLRQLTPVAVVVCIVLSVWAVGEAVIDVNPINYIANHPGSLQGEQEHRFGLKRAEGPFNHPIFFGVALVMVMPWAIAAGVRAKRGEGPRWWRFVPWVLLTGIFCTMSRGPFLASAMLLYLSSFLRWPRWRPALLVLGILAVVGATAGRSLVWDALRHWSADEAVPKQRIVINRKLYVFSGTEHRLLQFLVYEKAMARAGLFGFGTLEKPDAEHLRYVEPHLQGPFKSIDNHYIYSILRFGYLPTALFLAIGLCAIRYLLWPKVDFNSSHGVLAASMAAMMASVLLVLFTVFYAATDFGFIWMFSLGMAASWRAMRAEQEHLSARTAMPVVLRQLFPGHPPEISGA